MDIEKRIEILENKIDKIYIKVDKLYSAQQRASAFSWLKWIIIISVFLVVASYMRPYINQVINMYKTVLDMNTQIQDTKGEYQNILNDFFKQ